MEKLFILRRFRRKPISISEHTVDPIPLHGNLYPFPIVEPRERSLPSTSPTDTHRLAPDTKTEILRIRQELRDVADQEDTLEVVRNRNERIEMDTSMHSSEVDRTFAHSEDQNRTASAKSFGKKLLTSLGFTSVVEAGKEATTWVAAGGATALVGYEFGGQILGVAANGKEFIIGTSLLYYLSTIGVAWANQQLLQTEAIPQELVPNAVQTFLNEKLKGKLESDKVQKKVKSGIITAAGALGVEFPKEALYSTLLIPDETRSLFSIAALINTGINGVQIGLSELAMKIKQKKNQNEDSMMRS